MTVLVGQVEPVTRRWRTALGGVIVSGSAAFQVRVTDDGDEYLWLQSDGTLASASYDFTMTYDATHQEWRGTYEVSEALSGYQVQEVAEHSQYGRLSCPPYDVRESTIDDLAESLSESTRRGSFVGRSPVEAIK